MRRSPKKIKKILISAYTGLGHFVLKTPLIKKIEALYPGVKITIIAGNSFGTEFILNNYHTLLLSEKSNFFAKLLFFIKLRKDKYDVIFFAIDASPAFLIRGSILASIPIRVGHIIPGIRIPKYYFTHKVDVRINGSRNEIDMNYDLLQSIFGKSFTREYKPFVYVNNGECHYFNKYSIDKEKYICIQVGGANGLPTTKRWFIENYIILIKNLLSYYRDIKFIMLGDEGDAPIVEMVCEGIKSDRVINISGSSNLEETKILINSCLLLICHDSGLLHIGNALKKNVIAIYGPSDPDQYVSEIDLCYIIRNKIECSPCLGLFPGRFTNLTEEESLRRCPVPKCMQGVTVDMVYKKCVEILDKKLETSGELDD